MRRADAQRGFTLIELMMVVAVIALLAAVVIPTWTRETGKGKGKSEVTAMFAELATKLDARKSETQRYTGDIADTGAGTTTCPAAPTPSGANFQTTCIVTGSVWEMLRVQAPSSKMYCSYTIQTGASTDVLTPPAGFKNSQGLAAAEPAIASAWYYLVATCDEDGAGGNFTTFYQSSVDPKLQVQKEGS